MLKNKAIRNVVVVLISILMLLSASLIACKVFTQTQKNKDNLSAGTTITEIRNESQLEQFANSVNSDGLNFYTGQEVHLMADINLKGALFEPIGSYYRESGDWISPIYGSVYSVDSVFNGKFYGNGHTISNFTMQARGFQNWGYGLFAMLGPQAEVTGLKVKDVTAKTYKWVNEDDCLRSAGTGDFGGIAGIAIPGATISQCMVENFQVTVQKGYAYGNDDGTSSVVGGVVGNCRTPNDYNALNGTPELWTSDPDYTVKINNCIVKEFSVNNSEISGFSKKSIVGNVSDGEAVVQNILSIDSDNLDTFQKLSTSSYVTVSTLNCNTDITGKLAGFDYDSVWYQNNEHYDEYSMLRIFIRNVTVYFKVEDDDYGYVNVSSVEIVEYEKDSLDLSLASQLFGGQGVSVTANNGYEFDDWIWDEDANTYTATFSMTYFKIKCNPIVVGNETINPDDTGELEVKIGWIIKISYEWYWGLDCGEILVEAYRPGSSYGADDYVSYIVEDNKYILKETQDIIVEGDMEITPELILKEYGFEVG